MKNMERIRMKKGMSKEKLAAETEINFHSICAYEKLKRTPSVLKAQRIAKALGCTVEELME